MMNWKEDGNGDVPCEHGFFLAFTKSLASLVSRNSWFVLYTPCSQRNDDDDHVCNDDDEQEDNKNNDDDENGDNDGDGNDGNDVTWDQVQF